MTSLFLRISAPESPFLEGRAARWSLLPLLALLACALLVGCDVSVEDDRGCSINLVTLGCPVTWVTMSPMPTARDDATTGIIGTKIYVAGGSDSVSVLGTVEEYDTATDTWTNCGGTCASMPVPTWENTGAALNGKVYVFGGFSDIGASAYPGVVQEFDPATNTWTNCGGTCDAIPDGSHQVQSSATVVGNSIYLFGGGGPGGINGGVLQFNPALGSGNMWPNCGGTCAFMGLARTRARSILAGTDVYVIDGYDGNSPDAYIEQYDTVGNTWPECGGACPVPNLVGFEPSLGLIGSVIYVVNPDNNSLQADVETFSTVSQTWTQCQSACPQKPTTQGWGAGGVVNNKLYVIGGGISGGVTNVNEVLLPP
jgi:N-acetylneuraminic acid mutarotase